MALAHTKTELRAFSKETLITALIEMEAKHAACERELGALRNLHQFPDTAPPCDDPRRRAKRFMLATACYLAHTYRNVDTTIPAVSRAVINDLREGVRQYKQAMASVPPAAPPTGGE